MLIERKLAALADPTRMQLLERLAVAPQAVVSLAKGMPMSRPAISQHLKILKEAGLVTNRADGVRRIYEIDPQGLGQVRAFLDRLWDVALLSFKAEAERVSYERKETK